MPKWYGMVCHNHDKSQGNFFYFEYFIELQGVSAYKNERKKLWADYKLSDKD